MRLSILALLICIGMLSAPMAHAMNDLGMSSCEVSEVLDGGAFEKQFGFKFSENPDLTFDHDDRVGTTVTIGALIFYSFTDGARYTFDVASGPAGMVTVTITSKVNGDKFVILKTRQTMMFNFNNQPVAYCSLIGN